MLAVVHCIRAPHAADVKRTFVPTDVLCADCVRRVAVFRCQGEQDSVVLCLDQCARKAFFVLHSTFPIILSQRGDLAARSARAEVHESSRADGVGLIMVPPCGFLVGHDVNATIDDRRYRQQDLAAGAPEELAWNDLVVISHKSSCCPPLPPQIFCT